MSGGAQLRVYTFRVTEPWKGVGAGQRLEVLHDASSGGAFAQGRHLLVVSTKSVGDLFWVPRCGGALPVGSPQLKASLARLEEVIGIGRHTKIPARDRTCKTADDCTAIETDCGGCDCGTPVAKRAADAYRERHRRLCAVLRPVAVCERVCETYVPSCVEGLCR